VRDGLAANIISAMTQDRQQLMWLGTRNGLCCFDGYRFTTFRDNIGFSAVLPTNRILTVAANSEGDIWCATYDGRGFLFDTEQCRFIDVTAIIKRQFGIDIKLSHFYTMKGGHTWLKGKSNNNWAFRIDNNAIKEGKGIEVFGPGRIPLKGNMRKAEQDRDGNEWVFTDRGVQSPQYRIPSSVNYEYMVQSQVPIGSKDPRRMVYFASTDGQLGCYARGMKDIKRLQLPSDIRKITGILERDRSSLILATDRGVAVYNKQTGTTRLISLQNPSQPSPLATAIYLDTKGDVWAFSEGSGVTRIDPQGNCHWMMAEATSPIAETRSATPFFFEDRHHTVWVVPTNGTFSYYDSTRGQLIPYVLGPDRKGIADEPTIDKRFIDAQGNLWFTSTHDLTRVNFNLRRFTRLPIAANRDVRAVAKTPNGDIIAGLDDGMLAAASAVTHSLSYMTPTGALVTTPTTLTDKAYAILYDSKGRLWMGTKGHGLYMKAPGKPLQQFNANARDPYAISHNGIYDIHEDRHHRIWIATYGSGISLVQTQADGSIRFLNAKTAFKKYPAEHFQQVRRITSTPGGTVIASTTDGIVAFDGRFTHPSRVAFHTTSYIPGDSTSLATSDVLQTLVTHSGQTYVVTMSGPLQQLVSGSLLGGKAKFRSIDNPNSLGGIILSIVEDRQGNLWLPRENSLESYHPASGTFSTCGITELGNNVEFSEAKPYYDAATDEILLGAVGGIVMFRPQHLQKSLFKPRVVFTSVQYQGDATPHPLLYTKELEVPSSRRNLTISFSALDYQDNYLIRYAYMMEGVDKTWNYTSSNHAASYNRLPPGRHRLLVKSTNADGVWMDNVATLSVYAHPTFWETIWAKLLYAAIALALLWGIFYTYALRKRAQLDKEMSEMKTQFFTEIGHKLRTPLTLIGGPVTEVLDGETLSAVGRSQLEMVQRNSRRMLALVNRMLEHNSADNYLVDDHSAPVFTGRLSQEPGPDTPLKADTPAAGGRTRDKLLVVEDNDDLRQFLTEILSTDYEVITAENGQQGLERAEKEFPAFIITDVMMPVMDGLAMVHHIKQNKDICHIPVIVLSAKASLDDRLQGLSEGVDDYITKPFSATYLKRRIENIISQRHALQQAFLEQLTPEEHTAADPADYQLAPPQIVDADQEMMNRLMEYLEANIGNADLRIEDLAVAVNLGRTVFYEKVKSIVGMTPIDFVRHVRMQRAEQLIAMSKDSFSQIAYAVGFTDPKYFSKCFKKETGMAPSEYRAKTKGNAG
jgi:DNA-binding response OmpR family regulator/ligand-binding sensor domain-containing protein